MADSSSRQVRSLAARGVEVIRIDTLWLGDPLSAANLVRMQEIRGAFRPSVPCQPRMQ